MKQPEPIRVLIVDDVVNICNQLVRDLGRAGLNPVAVTSGAEAIQLLDTQRFDVVVSDLAMPEVDGIDVLRHARSLNRPVPVIMITGFAKVESAVLAMKNGASDFITKPIDVTTLRAAIQVAAGPRESKREAPPTELVGSEDWLVPFNELLHKIANSSRSVLLLGETGTGKSAVAREIARVSTKRTGEYVELNCAAIPATLLEATLFGTHEGVFTDAKNAAGLVEIANGGTIFLDEVGELELPLQAKLLRLIQDKKFARIGGREQDADVRFIAATNRDLEAEVEAGRFRKDLYYRLNVVELRIPPLRERVRDIPILIDHFRRGAEDDVPEFSEEAIQVLLRYEWPGNIRELKNLIDRLGVFGHTGKNIHPDDLEAHFMRGSRDIFIGSAPPAVRADALDQETSDFTIDLDGQGLEDAMNGYMRAIIVSKLQQNGGNKSKTARELDVKRTTLIERCRKLGITDADIEGTSVVHNDNSE